MRNGANPPTARMAADSSNAVTPNWLVESVFSTITQRIARPLISGRTHLLEMNKSRATKCVVVFAILTLGSAAWYGVSQARQAVDETLNRASTTKLKHAISEYLDVNGTFPPRVSIDPKTSSETSWRVLLELLSGGGAGKYDLAKQWDVPGNIEFAVQPTYIHYNNDGAIGLNSIPVTRFVALASPDAVIGGNMGVKTSDVKDGLENTLLLAQVLQSSIPWSEPRDFDFQVFALSSKSDDKVSSCSNETGFTNQRLLFADFEAYRVLRPIPLKYFEALWTYAGSDGVTRDELIRQGYLSR